MAVCNGQEDGSENRPNKGRFGFLGQYGAEWSSSRQKLQLTIELALPVNASLYRWESLMDQLRFFLVKALV